METVAKIIKTFKTELKNIYPPEEIRSFTDILLKHFADINKTEAFLYPDKNLNDEIIYKLASAIEKLKQEYPVQYITGQTEFYSLKFKVSPDVLIPRPETEELVDLIIKNHQNHQKIKILDIGTGSACIPVSLKKHLPETEIFALDISEKALHIARENAKINQTQIYFFNDDILNPQENKYTDYDIIVSNPPYVREKEKTLMQKNVLENEPHLALFVKDDDALIFYRAIINFAKNRLKPKGFIYFEINEALAGELKDLLKLNNFTDIEIIKDLFGKNRIIKATKSMSYN